MWSVCPLIPSGRSALAIVHQRGFTRPLKLLAVASGLQAGEVGGNGVTRGEAGLFASGVFSQVPGSQAEGHLTLLLGPVPRCLILKCVMQALFRF